MTENTNSSKNERENSIAIERTWLCCRALIIIVIIIRLAML